MMVYFDRGKVFRTADFVLLQLKLHTVTVIRPEDWSKVLYNCREKS